MPVRKRRRSRSRSRPRLAVMRRGGGRKTGLRLRRGLLGGTTHRFSKWASPVQVNCTNGSYYPTTAGLGTLYSEVSVNEIDFACVFQFNDLPESTQFAALYDQYKIHKVILHVELMTNPNASWFINQGSGVSNNYNFYPRMWFIRDHDDYIAPTVSGLASYSRVQERILTPTKSIKIGLKPSILEQTYSGARSVKFNPGWLDMADVNVPHYGIKFAIDFANNYTSATEITKPPTAANPNLTQWEFRIRAQYIFSCKTPR